MTTRNEIICPHCAKAFKIDDTAFADILKQVRDNEFNAELHARIEDAVNLAVAKANNEAEKDIAKKQAEIAELKAANESAAKLAEAHTKNELQADAARREVEITKLQARLASVETQKDMELAKLHAKLDAAATEKQLAVTTAVSVVEKQRDELAGELQVKDHEQRLLQSSLRERHDAELKLKDEQIAQYKDFKAKQSVKLLGESLEQHCEVAFRQWQSAGAFRNVSFGKDNDSATSGTKGDYIYRETDEAGNEILSIMFDMKNEADETATKKKNEDHFKKLDKDRAEKNCDYAVLVSVLEAESELYAGITDVSYAYDKMYVVRPQFFVPIITLLRNVGLESLRYKAELALVREQNIDITNFENELHIFQDGFMKNVKDSSNKFKEAMDGIDLTIKKLESIKEALRLSNKHLLTAGGKVENVSVKRLSKNNPTMAAKFAELRGDEDHHTVNI